MAAWDKFKAENKDREMRAMEKPNEQSLLPCPFCGDDDLLPMFDDEMVVWQIECGNCGGTLRDATEEKTVKA